ncbi:hypothetical protein HPB50_009317 [Hyalomma asiaticum]|uniref:Uncharacterized protein n=1 Tax=Hyalomma asiaticum TaxID=266040 RepID=A0ACB7T6L1_HYAAI|nr:hypothetical protein HPB50_009317 [Hyalomma asiaticum]
MPKSCCVPRCKSNAARNSDLCYHELPAKQQLRDAWLRHISRQGNVKGSHWVPNSRAVVCSIHFKEEDYKVGLKRKVLRPTAVPTQFPSYLAYMLPAVSKKRRPVDFRKPFLSASLTIALFSIEWADENGKKHLAERDEEILHYLAPYKEKVHEAVRKHVGSTKVLLEADKKVCRYKECNSANLMADAFMDYYANRDSPVSGAWSTVNAAIINGGSAKASITQTFDMIATTTAASALHSQKNVVLRVVIPSGDGQDNEFPPGRNQGPRTTTPSAQERRRGHYTNSAGKA